MLNMCVLCIGLNIYFKDVHTGHLQEIDTKEVFAGYFPYTSILKMYIPDILPTHLG